MTPLLVHPDQYVDLVAAGCPAEWLVSREKLVTPHFGRYEGGVDVYITPFIYPAPPILQPIHQVDYIPPATPSAPSFARNRLVAHLQ